MSNQNKIDNTLEVYNKIAKNFSECWIDNPNMNEQLLKFIAYLKNKKKVLDVGCGMGRDVKFLIEQGIDAIGLDISQEMIRISKENVKDGHFIVGNMLEMNFDPECFDGIWACASIVHLPRSFINKILLDFNRILKTDGILYLSLQRGEGGRYVEDGRYYEYYQAVEITEYLNLNGFQVIETLSNLSFKNTFNKPRTTEWMNFYAKKLST